MYWKRDESRSLSAPSGRSLHSRLENHFPDLSFLADPHEIRPFLDNGLQCIEKSFLAPRLVVIRQSGNVSSVVIFDPKIEQFENFNKTAARRIERLVKVADDFITAFEILLLNLEVRSGFLDANVITDFSSFLPFA